MYNIHDDICTMSMKKKMIYLRMYYPLWMYAKIILRWYCLLSKRDILTSLII